jgi:hypothetical protein
MNPSLITSENLSLDLLKGIFDAAFVDYSFSSKGHLLVNEEIQIWVNPNREHKDRITLCCFFTLESGVSEIARLQAANQMNANLVAIRTYITGEQIVFEWDIPVAGGISPKALILAIKKFASIPLVAGRIYGQGIIR